MSSPENLTNNLARTQDPTQTQEITTSEQKTVEATKKKKDDVKVEEVFSTNLPPPLMPTTMHEHVVNQHSVPTGQDQHVGAIAKKTEVKHEASVSEEKPVDAKSQTIELENSEEGFGINELFQEPEDYKTEAIKTGYNPDLPVSSRKAHIDVFEALGYEKNEINELLVQDDETVSKAMAKHDTTAATRSVWVMSRDDKDVPQFIHLHGEKPSSGTEPTPEHMNQLEGGNPILFHYGNVIKVMVPSEMPPPHVDFAAWEKAKDAHLNKVQDYKQAIAKQFPDAKIVIVSVPLEKSGDKTLFETLTAHVSSNLNVTFPTTALNIETPKVDYVSGMQWIRKILGLVVPNAITKPETHEPEEKKVDAGIHGAREQGDKQAEINKADAVARQAKERVEERRQQMQKEVDRVNELERRQNNIKSS